jgi:hypothetical protein
MKPVLTLFAIILKAAGAYEEGVISAKSGYIYLSIISNISIGISMYCLVLFYTCTKFDLDHQRPMVRP